MKQTGRYQSIADKARESNQEEDFPNESAGRISLTRSVWILNYAYDAGLGKMRFVVQKAQLHPVLKHLRSKNLEAWSCFSNVVMGEVIVEATPEASEQALADFMENGISLSQ